MACRIPRVRGGRRTSPERRTARGEARRGLLGTVTVYDDERTAYDEAAHWFAATTRLVDGRWAEPGLGEWDVRALVGHTSRALLTVEAYLANPAPAVEVATTADYYAATRAATTGPQVAQRGRDAGAALGDDPPAAVTRLVAQVTALLTHTDGTELLTTIAGGMRLADYLPTRTFELVVHTADLATALGAPAEPPPSAAASALRVLSALAVQGRAAGAVLLAATGRGPLPDQFSIL